MNVCKITKNPFNFSARRFKRPKTNTFLNHVPVVQFCRKVLGSLTQLIGMTANFFCPPALRPIRPGRSQWHCSNFWRRTQGMLDLNHGWNGNGTVRNHVRHVLSEDTEGAAHLVQQRRCKKQTWLFTGTHLRGLWMLRVYHTVKVKLQFDLIYTLDISKSETQQVNKYPTTSVSRCYSQHRLTSCLCHSVLFYGCPVNKKHVHCISNLICPGLFSSYP